MKKPIVTHLPTLLSADLLHEHPNNSQRQSKHEFKQLRQSIQDNGFDESLIVRPVGDGFEVVSGNHRFRAGKAEGMTEFPCVVRNDWDDIKAEIESVRRNYVRGTIDRDAFTLQVDRLSQDGSLALDVIYEQMGFEDVEAFSQIYKREKEFQDKVAEETISPPAVRILDDLGAVVSTLLAEHGATVPNSFIIFPVGGKNHLYVATNGALRKIVQNVANEAFKKNLDINIALAGLLTIGAAQSKFFEGNGTEEVRDQGTGSGPADLELIGKVSRDD